MSETVGRRRDWGKTCAACAVSKPITEFYVKKRYASGRVRTSAICKTCYKAKVDSYQRAKRNSKRADVPATASAPVVIDETNVGISPGPYRLSDLRIRQLAEWYAEASYRHYSPAALAAGALDAELRAILCREVGQGRVEVEFARVVGRAR